MENITQYEELLDQIHEARMNDDEERFEELSKKIPVGPPVAMGFKRAFGVEFIKNLEKDGYDFSEVEKRYGSDWLAR